LELGLSDVDDSSAMKNATRAKLTGRVQKKLKFWDGLGCSALGGHGACIHPLIRELRWIRFITRPPDRIPSITPKLERVHGVWRSPYTRDDVVAAIL